MINEHTDENAFPCQFCSISLRSKDGLKYHIIAVHPEQSKDPVEWYKCEICDYKSKHKIGLKYHRKVHMEDQDVECNICRRSVSKTGLKGHIKSVHGAYKYQCDICDYVTTRQTDLERHNKSVHLRSFGFEK